MATFQKYINAKARYTMCGIPYVNLEGTIEDWRKIRDKINILSNYDYPWVSKLDEIMNEFINAKEGNINQEFWKTMVRYRTGNSFYDPTQYSGWFVNFFPYDKFGDPYKQFIPTENTPAKELLSCHLTLDVSLTSTPKIINLTLLSGFVGATQDPKTLAIKPEIGWIIHQSEKEEENELVI